MKRLKKNTNNIFLFLNSILIIPKKLHLCFSFFSSLPFQQIIVKDVNSLTYSAASRSWSMRANRHQIWRRIPLTNQSRGMRTRDFFYVLRILIYLLLLLLLLLLWGYSYPLKFMDNYRYLSSCPLSM